MVLEGNIDGEPLVVINNHFKCCGDGVLEINDSGDEETRRLRAVQLLKQYVSDYFADYRVIIVGDMNDEISDEAPNNVFQEFIDDSDNWLFADMTIAQNPNTLWSYPLWPSHIDHILINSHTFADFEAPESQIRVMPVQEVFAGGISEFDDEVSDHLPVVIRLMPQPNQNPFAAARFGGQGTFEAVTWNLDQFGYNDYQTTHAALAIEAINADVVALQEIVNEDGFEELKLALPDYVGYLGTGATSDTNLGFLYRSESLTDVSVTPILQDQGTIFIRTPLLLQANFEGKPISVINVHFKCCGDGTDHQRARYVTLRLRRFPPAQGTGTGGTPHRDRRRATHHGAVRSATARGQDSRGSRRSVRPRPQRRRHPRAHQAARGSAPRRPRLHQYR